MTTRHADTTHPQATVEQGRPVPRRAAARDAHLITSCIARAFHNLAVSQWLVPDPVERVPVLYANFRLHVEHALTHGHVFTTTTHDAAAVWLPTEALQQPIGDYDRHLDERCGQFADRFRTLDHAFAQRHPDEAHHYLAYLAVQATERHRGIGSTLLTAHHALLDNLGLPAALVASDSRSRELYLRHGYEDHGDLIQLPDGPVMYPMRRHPHRQPRP